jgi:endonuclease-3
MTAKKPKTRSVVSFGRETLSQKAIRAGNIDKRLSLAYPDACCTLDFNNPLELLVATILAAQCTDKRVNLITPKLFKIYPSAKAYAQAKPSTFEKVITSVGFFRNKTKSILACGQMLQDRYAGKVPKTMEELISLPGVGRKTANVILGNAFNIAGIVVDTHAGRLSRRLGLSKQQNPDKVEQNLMRLVPQNRWTMFSHLLVFHGRSICLARKPDCPNCLLSELCPSAFAV